jgi:hypothetical protein
MVQGEYATLLWFNHTKKQPKKQGLDTHGKPPDSRMQERAKNRRRQK